MAKKLGIKEQRQKFYDNFLVAKELLKPYYIKEKKNYILGIDLSTTRTGSALTHYGISDLEEPIRGPYMTKSIKPKGSLTRYNKVDFILEDIQETIKINKNFMLIAIEGYSLGNPRMNQSIITSIAEARGIIQFGLRIFKIPILQVAPLQLKKWALGVSRGDKNLILRSVYKNYGLEVDNDDEADAVILADIARCFSIWVTRTKIKSNDDEYLREFMLKSPKSLKRFGIKLHKYQMEVLSKLVMEQGDKLDQYWK